MWLERLHFRRATSHASRVFMNEHRDRAMLLIAAGQAAEFLETRAATTAPTVTLSTDEAREIAEQFGRVVSLLTVHHLALATAAKRPPLREVA